MSATRCNGRSCVRSSSSSTIIQKQKSRKQKAAEEEEDDDVVKMKSTTSCKFRIPRKRDLSPLKYLKNLGGKMVGVLRMISPRRRRASPRVTSSSSERAKTCVAPLDSHRAEAIDDCIEFINSSSSLPRSNSTSQ